MFPCSRKASETPPFDEPTTVKDAASLASSETAAPQYYDASPPQLPKPPQAQHETAKLHLLAAPAHGQSVASQNTCMRRRNSANAGGAATTTTLLSAHDNAACDQQQQQRHSMTSANLQQHFESGRPLRETASSCMLSVDTGGDGGGHHHNHHHVSCNLLTRRRSAAEGAVKNGGRLKTQR